MSVLKKNKQHKYRQAKEAIFEYLEKYIGSKNTKRQRLKNTSSKNTKDKSFEKQAAQTQKL